MNLFSLCFGKLRKLSHAISFCLLSRVQSKLFILLSRGRSQAVTLHITEGNINKRKFILKLSV